MEKEYTYKIFYDGIYIIGFNNLKKTQAYIRESWKNMALKNIERMKTVQK